jgi:large subunit ribosomal protein L25
MAERVNISAESRSVTGKKVKNLRKNNLIPAVIYGQSEPLLVQIERGELRRALRRAGTTELIDVQINGDTRTVLAREIQQHVTRGDLIHIDFFEVNLLEKVTMEVTLNLVGELLGSVRTLGSVALAQQFVEVECLPTDLISEIQVDVSQIQTPDDTIYVRDLPQHEGVEVLTDPNVAVTTFEYTRLEEEEEEEEEDLLFAPAADSVEVIGKGKEEEEEDF